MKADKTVEQVYDQCLSDGKIQFTEGDVDADLAQSLLSSAEEEYKEQLEIEKIREGKTNNYSLSFGIRYDIFRKLLHALALFDKLKPSDHQCVIAYMCTKHPEYELDWETMEAMRKLRNDIQYRGVQVKADSWNMHKLKFDVYIKSLKKFVKSKLSEKK